MLQCTILKKKILARIKEVAVLVRSENLSKIDPLILVLEPPKMMKEKKKQLKYRLLMKPLDQNKLKRALHTTLKINKSSSLLLICLITSSFNKLSINFLRKERFFHLTLPFLPQSLLNSLRNNFFKMTDFNILLFFQTNP